MNGSKAYAAALVMVGLVACSSSDKSDPPPKTIVLQGFEFDTGDWEASQDITRVASGGGALQLTASSGGHYAELENLANGYQDPGYGDGGFSRFGGRGTVYNGDFYQSIDVYVDASWAPAAVAGVDGFWIDMTPHHEDPDNYGAEHNFHLRATGSEVEVRVDGQTTPIASITTDGWYTFLMTWKKAAAADDPVITDMVVLDSQNTVLGTTTVYATSPGGPFKSQDLRGNGYVWITVWQNGFAGDVLAIDHVETALLPY
jgi:hypothetical protein